MSEMMAGGYTMIKPPNDDALEVLEKVRDQIEAPGSGLGSKNIRHQELVRLTVMSIISF